MLGTSLTASDLPDAPGGSVVGLAGWVNRALVGNGGMWCLTEPVVNVQARSGEFRRGRLGEVPIGPCGLVEFERCEASCERRSYAAPALGPGDCWSARGHQENRAARQREAQSTPWSRPQAALSQGSKETQGTAQPSSAVLCGREQGEAAKRCWVRRRRRGVLRRGMLIVTDVGGVDQRS